MRVFQTLHWDIPFLHLQFEGIHLVYVTGDSVCVEREREEGRERGRGREGGRGRDGGRGRERRKRRGRGVRKEGGEEEGFKECARYIKLKSQ